MSYPALHPALHAKRQAHPAGRRDAPPPASRPAGPGAFRAGLRAPILPIAFLAALVTGGVQPGVRSVQAADPPLFQEEAAIPLAGGGQAVAINADESILAAAAPDGAGRWRVQLFDRPSKALLGVIVARVGDSPRLRFSPVEDLLLIVGSQALQLWELPISPLAPDKPLASEHRRWEEPLGKPAVEAAGFGIPPDYVYWSRGDALYRRPAAADSTPAGEPYWRAEDPQTPLAGLSFDAQNALLALTFPARKEVGLLDLNARQAQPALEGHRFPVVAARFSRHRPLLSLDSGNNLVRWDDRRRALSTAHLEGLPAGFEAAAFTELGERYLLLTGKAGEGGSAVAIDARNNRRVGALPVAGPERIAVSPTGRYLALAEGDVLKLYGFARPAAPLAYVRHLRGMKAFRAAQSYVRLMDGAGLSPQLKADLLAEAGREPPGRELQAALARLALARAEGDSDGIRYWAEQVSALQPDHPEAVAALRQWQAQQDEQTMQQAREAYNLGQHRLTISLLSNKIAEDSRFYPEAAELIRQAEAKRSVQTVLVQAREKMNLGDFPAAEALANEALRRDVEHPAALALQDELADRSGRTRRALIYSGAAIVTALAIVGFLSVRFRRRLAPYVSKLRLDEDGPRAAGPRPTAHADPAGAKRHAAEPRPPHAGERSPPRGAPGGPARRKVLESLLAGIEERIGRIRQADLQRLHTALLMELEAELHAIQRRLADPSTELGAIHARLKEMGARLASLKIAPPAPPPRPGREPNHYELLQLKPGATAEEIRTAYHRLLKQYHPDLHNSSEYNWVKVESERMSKKISEAYEVLIDTERRARYDLELRNPRRPGL